MVENCAKNFIKTFSLDNKNVNYLIFPLLPFDHKFRANLFLASFFFLFAEIILFK